jgi:hypothetical protein
LDSPRPHDEVSSFSTGTWKNPPTPHCRAPSPWFPPSPAPVP